MSKMSRHVMLLLLASAGSVVAQTIWDGGGKDAKWGTAKNWNPDVTPTFGATTSLVFGGSVGTSPDTNGNRTINAITFAAGAASFSLIGDNGQNNETLTLAGTTPSLSQLATNSQSLLVNRINWSSSGTIATTGAGSLTIGNGTATTGQLYGTGNINKTGIGGPLILNANNANWSGNLTISQGAVQAVYSGSALGTGTTTVANGAALELGTGGLTFANNLSLAGSGPSGTGALRSMASTGTNTLSGTTTLSADARMGADAGGALNLTGAITAANKSLTVDTTGSVALSGNITLGSGAVSKTGSGALTLSGSNSYSGGTALNQGTLNLNSNTAPGTGPLTLAGGTLDNTSGVTVILANNNPQSWAGDFTFTGTNNLVLGAGAVTLGGSRQVTVSAKTLTVGGNISGAGLALTKAGAGTLALNGPNSTVGAFNLNDGTLSVGGSSTLNTGDFNALAGTTLIIASGGTLKADVTGTATFSGNLSAAGGTFEKRGAGTLAFNTSFNAGAGSTLILNGGTIQLLGTSSLTFGTIHITGTTTLDFGNNTATTLNSAHLIIDFGVTVSVINWISLSDIWYATSTINGSSSPLDLPGNAPLNQVTFSGLAPASATTWVTPGDFGYFDHEIRPTPEPSTYGAIFLSGCLALLGFRRWRAARR
jgi:autotransporter-associated beta strand protein